MKKEYKTILITLAVLALLIIPFSFKPRVVFGKSMEPTVMDKSYVFSNKLVGKYFRPKVNDIVFYKNKNDVLVGRIVREENDKYFIEGDNKNNSHDSRDFGFVERGDIVGKYVFTLFRL